MELIRSVFGYLYSKISIEPKDEDDINTNEVSDHSDTNTQQVGIPSELVLIETDDSDHRKSSNRKRGSPAIGIDLGTSKCCVGVVRNGKVDILKNERGNKTTPSYVAFTDTDRLVGEGAKSKIASNPNNTVYGVKKIIGKEYEKSNVICHQQNWPFKIEKIEGKPFITVTYKKKPKIFHPEMISAMLLTEMKQIAESHLKCTVESAVISVPAYFDNAQRQATKDAAEIAGLNVLALINEPTAAAIAYKDNINPTKPQTILVFDFGGGVLDVSIIKINKTSVSVEAVAGDTQLGGQYLDLVVMDILMKSMTDEDINYLFGSPSLIEILRYESEKAKHSLTHLSESRILIDCFMRDHDFASSVSKDIFELKISQILSDRINSILQHVLNVSKFDKNKVDEVILVGGSSRIPKVRSILQKFFNNKTLNENINPDEAVAHGAAYLAAVLSGDNQVGEIFMNEMIQSPIENSMTFKRFYRFPPPQQLSLIFKLDNISFNLDSYGIFRRLYTNHYSTVVEQIGLTHHELDNMKDLLKEFGNDAFEDLQCAEVMNDLESCCYQLKRLVNSKRWPLSEKHVDIINDQCQSIINWLSDNTVATLTEYQERKDLIVSLCSSLFESYLHIEGFSESVGKTLNVPFPI